jgi:PAS domain S-box-containing protein
MLYSAPVSEVGQEMTSMNTELVKTGIDVIGAVPWGTHFCQFYQTKEDLLDTLVPYFKAGLENNEFCMWITAEPLSAQGARKTMRQAVPDFADRLSKGQIEILPHTKWYLKGGSFDGQRVLDGWVDKLNAALGAGYAGLRLSGNTFWLEEQGWKSFADYEAAVNKVIGGHRMLALCTYSLDKCGAAEVMDVIRNHEFALIRKEGEWELIENAIHKKTKESMGRSEERFRSIFEESPVGIELYDADGRLVNANNACLKTFGVSAVNEVKGFELFKDSNVSDEVKEQLRRGETVRYESPIDFEKVKEYQLYSTSKSGTACLDVMITPLGTREGEPASGYLVQVQDITERKQAEAALWESEEKYRLLFQNMAEGFALYELLYDQEGQPVDWRVLETNNAYTRHTGLTREENVGRRVGEFYPEAVLEYLPRFAQVVATQMPAEFETYAKAVGRYQRVTIFPAGGHRFASVFEDISERVEAERRANLLAEMASELLRSDSPQLVVNSLCPVAMALLDCHAFFNFLVDESAGRLRLNTFAGITEEQAREIEWLDRGMAVCDCAALDGCRLVAENILETPDPRTELVKSYGIQAYACHPLMAQNRVLGTLSFGTRTRTHFTDEELSLMGAVTDLVANAIQHKRTVDALRETRDYLDRLLDYANAPIIVWDFDLRITRFNRAFQHLTGLREDEVLGRQLDLLFPEKTRKESLAQIRRTLAGEIREAAEIPILRADGSVGTVLWNSATIYASDGERAIATIAQSQDITERKLAEDEVRNLNQELTAKAEALEMANSELQSFSYSVSHDLRAPLRSIDGFSLALLEDYANKLDGSGKDYLERVRKASQLMGRLIDDLLELSRVGRADMRWKRVDLSGLAREITKGLQNAEPKRRGEFIIAPDMSGYGDAPLLRAMLTNLLGNAWKFTGKRDRPKIEFGVRNEAGQQVYFVRDNGVGFDMTYADKLFVPFQRLHQQGEFPGTGIGLATVKRIITRHRGRVWAEGEADNSATFYFTLSDNGERK